MFFCYVCQCNYPNGHIIKQCHKFLLSNYMFRHKGFAYVSLTEACDYTSRTLHSHDTHRGYDLYYLLLEMIDFRLA